MRRAITFFCVAFGALLWGAACSSDDVESESAARAGVSAPAQRSPTADPTREGPRPKTVVIDPGHGGDEVGAANYDVVEKDSNLDMAQRVERLLTAAGVRVVLTRREDQRVAEPPASADSGFSRTRFDLQARVDIANDEGADLFLSIHSNGSPDRSQNGIEVWYDPSRPFGEANRLFAETLLARVAADLATYGYAPLDRGIKDDTCFRFRFERCFTLFLLGPERTIRRDEVVRRGLNPESLGLKPGQEAIATRATDMPGVLLELLFISNAADAAVLHDDAARDVMAQAIAGAIMEMLGEVEADG